MTRLVSFPLILLWTNTGFETLIRWEVSRKVFYLTQPSPHG